MMFNDQHLKLIHLLFISIISVESSDQSVPVIKFKPKTAFVFSGEELDSVNAGFKRFSEFTVCFRYMARFGSDFFMIETNQIFGDVILCVEVRNSLEAVFPETNRARVTAIV